ncbi:unnamed protein product [Timema podura]|uniref:Uncharacterized protein n=1 Tax=Timema podura TaxID=61482 RepID=A0ABN7NU02_TIMPD|nr:unnamed protein product [Timema podura]
MEKFVNPNKKRKVEDTVPFSTDERKRKCRKYYKSYLDYSFTNTGVDNQEHPQCIVCLKVLSPDSMLPGKLKRNLETFNEVTSMKEKKS